MNVREQAEMKIETLDALKNSLDAAMNDEFLNETLVDIFNSIIDPIFNNLRKDYVELTKSA